MSLDAVLQFIASRSGQRFALVAHMRPDGDALGSTLGLAHCLNSLGHAAKVVNHRPCPDNLAFIADPALMAIHENPDWWRDYDCLGVLDCGDPERLSAINQAALGNLPTFTIDHHATSAGLGDAVWIEPSASSTGEMVARLIKQAGWPLGSDAALALWTAIVTDTGRFCYENTSAAALEAARDCLLAGADPTKAAVELFQSVSVKERRLQTLILERMQLHEGGKIAVSWLSREDFANANCSPADAQNLIDVLRDTAGVEVAIFLYEVIVDAKPDTPIKVSMRSRSPHNVIDIVKNYSGGGHARAAGCSLPGPLDAARDVIVSDVTQRFFRTV